MNAATTLTLHINSSFLDIKFTVSFQFSYYEVMMLKICLHRNGLDIGEYIHRRYITDRPIMLKGIYTPAGSLTFSNSGLPDHHSPTL